MLELKRVIIEVLGIICQKSERVGRKDSKNYVVRIFCSRGAPIPSRSEGLVVGSVVSCLEVADYVGITVEVYGSENCEKGALWRDFGGISPSKGPLHKDNHGCGNQPKNVRIPLPI